MRRDRLGTNQHGETGEYTFYFQITNGGGRKGCSVRVLAPSHQDATNLFRENWPRLELMARAALTQASDGRAVSLKLP
jgi:hypothetical protein